VNLATRIKRLEDARPPEAYRLPPLPFKDARLILKAVLFNNGRCPFAFVENGLVKFPPSWEAKIDLAAAVLSDTPEPNPAAVRALEAIYKSAGIDLSI